MLTDIRSVAWLLRVDADQRQVLPELLEHVVQVQPHLAADHHAVRYARQSIDFFDRQLIDLVVHVETSQVDPISLDDVDEFVDAKPLQGNGFD